MKRYETLQPETYNFKKKSYKIIEKIIEIRKQVDFKTWKRVQRFSLMSVFKKRTTKSGLKFTLVYSSPLAIHGNLVTINILKEEIYH